MKDWFDVDACFLLPRGLVAVFKIGLGFVEIDEILMFCSWAVYLTKVLITVKIGWGFVDIDDDWQSVDAYFLQLLDLLKMSKYLWIAWQSVLVTLCSQREQGFMSLQ